MSASFQQLIACMATLGTLAIGSAAQMFSPEMDDDPGPFSYFSQSTDEIGIPYAKTGTEITPEGSLYTGYGELLFFVGPEQRPIAARVRTLEEDLPIFNYEFRHLGIVYHFRVFSAPMNKREPGASIVNFVRVTVANPGPRPRAAFLTSAFRYQAPQTTDRPGGDNRFLRPIAPTGVGQFDQPGEAFSKDWVYERKGCAFLRGGRAVYLFPGQPEPQLSLTLHTHYNRIHPLEAARLDVTPETPTETAFYTLSLKPGESHNLDFVMPLEPVRPDTPELAQIKSASFDEAHAAVAAYWRGLVDRGMKIELPEAKVVDTFRASLIYDLMALRGDDGHVVQTVNLFQYHRFYLRDAADLVRMYDATGYSDIAAQVLEMFPPVQRPDRNFMSQPGQFDGWGEALWAFGEHYRRTHDLDFARRVFPLIARAIDWLRQARAADPLHLMPKSDVRDNEYVAAHLTGYNFLALDGLRSAIDLAKAVGEQDAAKRWQGEYDDYCATFLAVLDGATKRNGGAFPPALDADGWQGTDWGNLLSITPAPLFDPFDPRVTATLRRSQANYQEGIATYREPDDGVFLHHYLTIKNTLTELVRGEQEQAIREFYAELLHTSSTHTGFEYAIRPWGMRDFEGNLAPHGWFAADYRNLLRNMLVRERGDELHLLSAVSPEWIGAGKSIRVADAPTEFGPISFALETQTDGSAVLHLHPEFSRAPRAIVVHLPWFMTIESVLADGAPAAVRDCAVSLSPNVREVRVRWRRAPSATKLSYARTVESYKAEYRQRYERLLATGENAASAVDTWQVPGK
jgi:hypothetical protein